MASIKEEELNTLYENEKDALEMRTDFSVLQASLPAYVCDQVIGSPRRFPAGFGS